MIRARRRVGTDDVVFGPFHGTRKKDGKPVYVLLERFVQPVTWDALIVRDVQGTKRAVRVSYEPVYEVIELKYAAAGSSSWLSCENRGLHCDPAGSYVRVYDVTAMGDVQVQAGILEMTYRSPRLEIKFDFDESPTDPLCSVRSLSSFDDCVPGAIARIRPVS